MMWYAKEDTRPGNLAAELAIPFIRVWVAMLALGGLGHRQHWPLFFSYWSVSLAYIVYGGICRTVGVTKWRFAQTREELKDGK